MKKNKSFFIFLLGFYLVWTLRVIAFGSLIDLNSSLDPWLIFVLEFLLKFSIWFVPVVVYIKFIDKRNPEEYLKLNKNVLKGIRVGLVAGAVLAVVNVGYFVIANIKLNLEFNLLSIISTVVNAAIIEELMFRGFILPKLQESFDFTKANAITSVLFLLIHIPGWIFFGNQITPFLIVTILLLGYVFGFVKKYSDSLWSSIILHAVNNILSGII